MQEFVGALSLSDKLAVVGGGVTLVSGFLPWQVSREGDSLGLLSSGFLSILAAGIAVGAVVVRKRKLMPNLSPIAPWMVQLVAAGFSLLWALIYTQGANETRPDVLGEVVQISAPALGVYIAILSSLVCLAGTLLGLKDKSS